MKQAHIVLTILIFFHIFVKIDSQKHGIIVDVAVTSKRRKFIVRCCGKKSCTEGTDTTTDTTQSVAVEPTTTTVLVTTSTIITSTSTTTTVTIPTTTVSSSSSVSVTTTTKPNTTTKTTVTISVTLTTVPAPRPCWRCVTGTCDNDITWLAATNAIGSGGTVAGSVVIQNIGVKKYHIDPAQRLNYMDSILFCRQHGAELLTIESQEENDAVAAKLGELGLSGAYVWIGANKIGSCLYGWVSGEPWNYENWGPGQPSERTVENCAIMIAGKWYDLFTAGTAALVCEFT